MNYDFFDGIEIRFIHNPNLIVTDTDQQEAQDAVSDFMSDLTAKAIELIQTPEYKAVFDKFELDFTTAYVYE